MVDFNNFLIAIFVVFICPFLFFKFIDFLDKTNKYENLKKQYDYLKEKINTTELETLKNKRYKDELLKNVKKFIKKEFSDYDKLIIELETKNNPAYTSAQKVAEAQKKAKEFEKKYKLMKFEYETLFDLFPELEGYLDRLDENEDEIVKSFDELKEDYDYSIKYLSEKEYKELSEDERNQLALDRYIERRKTKWQIGRDYEMYIGYLYEKQGYKVQYTGIEQKLEDRGRDLIAENDNEILIVQCKYWSNDKVIHEKHLCQLYGTTIQFKRTNKTNKNVKAVFVTKTNLSDTAKEFAKDLKIEVIENKELENFPRIKCNINNNNKIYHLPFDQMYDKTTISKSKGESFEFTVKQATTKGFRRAKKYYLH